MGPARFHCATLLRRFKVSHILVWINKMQWKSEGYLNKVYARFYEYIAQNFASLLSEGIEPSTFAYTSALFISTTH